MMTRGLQDEALRFRKKAHELRTQAIVLALDGKREEALQTSDHPGIYALLGLKDEAIAQLQKQMQRAKTVHKSWYAVLKDDQSLEPLKTDPRFQAILQQEKAKAEQFREQYGDLVEVPDE